MYKRSFCFLWKGVELNLWWGGKKIKAWGVGMYVLHSANIYIMMHTGLLYVGSYSCNGEEREHIQ